MCRRVSVTLPIAIVDRRPPQRTRKKSHKRSGAVCLNRHGEKFTCLWIGNRCEAGYWTLIFQADRTVLHALEKSETCILHLFFGPCCFFVRNQLIMSCPCRLESSAKRRLGVIMLITIMTKD